MTASSLPSEPRFWARCNRRLERPMMVAGGILFQMLAATCCVALASGVIDGKPNGLTPDNDALDEYGPVGCGGGKIEIEYPLPIPVPQPDPGEVARMKQDMRRLLWLEHSGGVSISDINVFGYGMLSKALQEKLLGIGMGGEPNLGADSARSRSLRWFLAYRTSGTESHFSQLQSLGAAILVPIAPANERCILYRNLNDLKNRTIASDADFRSLNNRIRFANTRQESVRAICAELGVQERAEVYFTYFPKELEEELARKERGYRNRRTEDLALTIFRVKRWMDTREIEVDGQTVKKR